MSRLTSSLLLLLVAMIWGSTFVVQKWATTGDASIGPMAFTGARFLLGSFVVLPFAWREARAALQPIKAVHRIGFVFCGLALVMGSWMQQMGIDRTSITNAGFLTGVYVTIVPPLAWILFRRKPHWSVWPAMTGCVAGIWCLNGGSLTRFGTGDLWVLGGSLFWAAHVTVVGVVSEGSGRPLLLAWTQFVIAGIIGLTASGLVEAPGFATFSGVWPEILWAGGVSVGIAFTLQVVGQRYVPPGPAAVIFSSEMAFAALAGAIAFGERLSAGQWLGGCLIFVAIVSVEVVPSLRLSRRAAA